jgi:hypothetical protein
MPIHPNNHQKKFLVSKKDPFNRLFIKTNPLNKNNSNNSLKTVLLDQEAIVK